MFTLKNYFNQIKLDSVEMISFLDTLDTDCVGAILFSLVKSDKSKLLTLKDNQDKVSLLKDVKEKMTYSRILTKTENVMKIEYFSLYSSVLLKFLYVTDEDFQQKYHLDIVQDYNAFIQDIMLAYNQLNPHNLQMQELYGQINDLKYIRQYEKVSSNYFTFIHFEHTLVKQYFGKYKNIAKSMMLQELIVNFLLEGESTTDLGAIKSFYINENFSVKDACLGYIIYDKGDVINPERGYSSFDGTNVEQVMSNLNEILTVPEGLKFNHKTMYYEPIFLSSSEEEMVCINYPFLQLDT